PSFSEMLFGVETRALSIVACVVRLLRFFLVVTTCVFSVGVARQGLSKRQGPGLACLGFPLASAFHGLCNRPRSADGVNGTASKCCSRRDRKSSVNRGRALGTGWARPWAAGLACAPAASDLVLNLFNDCVHQTARRYKHCSSFSHLFQEL